VITVTCPVCGYGAVVCTIDPGEPEVRYTRNGDGSPGVPPHVSDWESDCGCSESNVVNVYRYALALNDLVFAQLEDECDTSPA